MRLLAFSDAHGDARTHGVRRYDEVVAAFQLVKHEARRRKVDEVFFLGDLGNPERQDTYRILGELSKLADALEEDGVRFSAVPGNHDVLEEDAVEPRSVLSALGHACVYETPYIIDGFNYGKPDGVPILYLPFTPSWAPYDPEEWARRFLEEHPEGPGIVLGHLNLEGIGPGSEAKEYARGREVFFPLDLLEPHADRLLLLNGHIHRRQIFRGVQIVGSLARFTHGEEDHEPSIFYAEI